MSVFFEKMLEDDQRTLIRVFDKMFVLTRDMETVVLIFFFGEISLFLVNVVSSSFWESKWWRRERERVKERSRWQRTWHEKYLDWEQILLLIKKGKVREKYCLSTGISGKSRFVRELKNIEGKLFFHHERKSLKVCILCILKVSSVSTEAESLVSSPHPSLSFKNDALTREEGTGKKHIT